MHQKINSASFLIAITASIACATLASTKAVGAAGGVNAPNASASSGAAIYKMVDANGRVTYTNSPVKGANKVELDPITVIPATPAGTLGDGQSYGQNIAKAAPKAYQGAIQSAAQNASQAAPVASLAAVVQSAPSALLIPVGVAPTIAQPEEPTPMPVVVNTLSVQPIARPVVPANAPPTAAAPPVTRSGPPVLTKPTATAVVTAVPANTASASATKLPVVKLSPTTVAPAKVEVAANVAALSPISMAAFAPTPASTNTAALDVTPVPQLQSSAAPARLRPTDEGAKITHQEQLLTTAKAQLAEEQRASESFRALRARLPAVIDQTNPAKAAIQNDIKKQVEQHFERIRNLQDQISQYEQNLTALQPPSPAQPRSQMHAQSSNAPSAAVNTAGSQ